MPPRFAPRVFIKSSFFLIPYTIPSIKTTIKAPPSTDNPGGGGGGGPWAVHTKLIKTNKIEANFLLFCTIILRKCIKKGELSKIKTLKSPFKGKNNRRNAFKMNYM